MSNYVNEDDFFSWYEEMTGKPILNKSQLLSDVASAYAQTGKGIYTIPSNKTATGKAESYAFTFENIGCCGASTFYYTFKGKIG